MRDTLMSNILRRRYAITRYYSHNVMILRFFDYLPRLLHYADADAITPFFHMMSMMRHMLIPTP